MHRIPLKLVPCISHFADIHVHHEIYLNQINLFANNLLLRQPKVWFKIKKTSQLLTLQQALEYAWPLLTQIRALTINQSLMLRNVLGALGLHHHTEVRMSLCTLHREKQLLYLTGAIPYLETIPEARAYAEHHILQSFEFIFWNIERYNPLPNLLFIPLDVTISHTVTKCTACFQKVCINISSKCASLQLLRQVMLLLSTAMLQKRERNINLLVRGMWLLHIRPCP